MPVACHIALRWAAVPPRAVAGPVRAASKVCGAPYGTRQQRSDPAIGGDFLLCVRSVCGFPDLFQELAMADLAFVVTTIAVFALVAFVAKGVTKL